MSETGYLQNLATNICSLRKGQGLTQEALADRLGLTFQAVSKWENFQSSPDIQLLPRLAEIFGVSVDRLFGIGGPEHPEEESGGILAQPVPAQADGTSLPGELPWADDGTLRVVLYKGRMLLQSDDAEEPKMVFRYEGEALNVESRISVECGDVGGSVQAGQNIHCGEVGGEVNAGRDVQCSDVGGDANAGRDIQCGDISGEASAGKDVRCGDVGGEISAGGSISCGDVGGSVSTLGTVSCGDVGGGVSTLGPVTCGRIGNEAAGEGAGFADRPELPAGEEAAPMDRA